MIKFLNNKTILITGGTGSFGKNFVKFLLDNTKVKKIIIFSRDELKQSRMNAELNDARLRFFLGDVRDLPRLQRAFRGVDIVIHTAALKQIPTLEYNPFEAIKTNIIGTQNLIEAAVDRGVKKVLFISTDKAAQPVNLYGATKLCAEKLFVNADVYSAGKTLFSCVRYGNVVGSRGSIVEILLKNRDIKRVYLTDERMTRFWITLEQSFKLVFFALDSMAGGEIFIPKIPSMRIIDLFDAIVPGAKKEIIGIRPGEKLHELLLTPEEARHSIELKNYFVILPEDISLFNNPVRYKNLFKKGKKLPSGFYFSSDNNKVWLSKKDFQKIIEKIELHS